MLYTFTIYNKTKHYSRETTEFVGAYRTYIVIVLKVAPIRV